MLVDICNEHKNTKYKLFTQKNSESMHYPEENIHGVIES